MKHPVLSLRGAVALFLTSILEAFVIGPRSCINRDVRFAVSESEGKAAIKEDRSPKRIKPRAEIEPKFIPRC